jgi:hypothetical protein
MPPAFQLTNTIMSKHSRPSEAQVQAIVEAVRQKSAEMPNGTQLERFELAINSIGLRELFSPKLNTCTASKYCRLSEGKDITPVKRGTAATDPIGNLPSQRIRQGESIIATALLELEQERDGLMVRVRDLDNLINKYKTFRK